MIRTATLVGLVMLCVAPAAAQTVEKAARMHDNRGVILFLSTPYNGTEATTRFHLRDRETGVGIPLQGTLDTSAATCPATVANRFLICLRLPDGDPALDDGHEYQLDYPAFQLTSGKVLAGSVTVPALRAVIVQTTLQNDGPDEQNFVHVYVPRDLSQEKLTPRVQVNGANVSLVPEDQSGCYVRNSLEFRCDLNRSLHHGHQVVVRLVRSDGSVFLETPPYTVRLTPPTTDAEANLRLSASFTRVNGEETGSVAFVLRSCRFWTRVELCNLRFGGIGDPVEGSVNPYVDLQLSTEKDGRYDLGIQIQTYIREVPLTRLVDLRITPRREANQAGDLSHLMYVDAEARFYIHRLQYGPFVGGRYRLLPRAGYERGWTSDSPDEVRIERDDPERWKLGASLALEWDKGDNPLFPAGGAIRGEWDAYDIRENPAYVSLPDEWLHMFDVRGEWKVAPNVGLSLTRRTGRQRPVFRHTNSWELGFTFLQ